MCACMYCTHMRYTLANHSRARSPCTDHARFVRVCVHVCVCVCVLRACVCVCCAPMLRCTLADQARSRGPCADRAQLCVCVCMCMCVCCVCVCVCYVCACVYATHPCAAHLQIIRDPEVLAQIVCNCACVRACVCVCVCCVCVCVCVVCVCVCYKHALHTCRSFKIPRSLRRSCAVSVSSNCPSTPFLRRPGIHICMYVCMCIYRCL